MKKLLISSLIFGLLFIFGDVDAVLAMEDLIPVGSNVIIVKDLRKDLPPGKLATDKKGKIFEYVIVMWVLVDKNGLFENKRVMILPQGYTKWDVFLGEDWPSGKTGIPYSTLIIQMEDGSTIMGNQCYWILVDKKGQEKMVKIFTDRITKWGDFMQKKKDEHEQKQQDQN